MNSKLEIKTYAKINLFLDILFKREDGYHEISTIYQNISLGDTLFFEIGGNGLQFSCIGNDKVPADEKNLVIKAVRKFEEATGIKTEDLKISLQKNIPTGAGMGGGSSNAAGTLVAINRLYSLGLSDTELEVIGAKIGMDVPFFIRGGCAAGSGRGEIITPLENKIHKAVIVVYPGHEISTPYAYSLFKNYLRKSEKKLDIKNFIEVLKNKKSGSFTNEIYNKFEEMLSKHYSWIKETTGLLIEKGCEKAFMTGSGSAIIGLTDSNKNAEKIKDTIKNMGLFPLVEAAEFISTGWEIISEN